MPQAPYAVVISAGAERDLADIATWLAEQRSAADAMAWLDAFLDKIDTLERFPLRGPVPPELATLGMDGYRQVLLLPYRIIYAVSDQTVSILVAADGRRDMQALLVRRLLTR